MQVRTQATPGSSARNNRQVQREVQVSRSVTRPLRHVPQVGLSDVINQLSNIDRSTLEAAVNAAQLSDLPAHWGTTAVQQALNTLSDQLPAANLAKEAAGQLDAITHSAEIMAAQQQVESLLVQPISSAVDATLSAVTQEEAAVAGLLDSLLVQPMSGAVDGFMEGVSNVASKAAHVQIPAGQLPAHWGTLAVEGVVENLTGSDLESLMSSLTPDQAMQLAGGKLQDAVKTLGEVTAAAAAAGNTPSNAELPKVLNDLRSLLSAASPASMLTTLSIGTSPAGDIDATAVQAVIARLADSASGILANTGAAKLAAEDMVTLALSFAGVMYAVSASAGRAGANAAGPALMPIEAELGYEYDPKTLEVYFQRRPVLVMKRSAMVAFECAQFGLALLKDMVSGGFDAHEKERALQLRNTIERLGPAYIKVAQALSTRVDLLTPEYFMQIQLLQDRVPPFPDTAAREVMVKSFGRPVEKVFSEISEKPIAAASIGQVYRATLRPELGGGDVAVKVQRPGVLDSVALDLYLIRNLAAAIQPQMRSDWVAIIDTWALRFFHEMDYIREADNAEKFAQEMEPLQGVDVPVARRDLSSHNVLTSEWIAGERLSESKAADVRQLCDTLLTAYLIQLCETGNLHADPHTGNLLRTPDGKIAVLDFGLMTEVTEEQRWAMLEYIAHLSTQDWPALAKDLQTLGFIPAEVDPAEAGLVEPLGNIMTQLIGGGGAAKVNIDKVMTDLEQLGEKYPFRIPPFFALILRAFSVIEGIALGVDPDYAIVAECFPYLSRRLLADDSPRARAILKDILYGGKRRLDVDRLLKLADGFSAYTTDGLTAPQAPQMRLGGLAAMLGEDPSNITASSATPGNNNASGTGTTRTRSPTPAPAASPSSGGTTSMRSKAAAYSAAIAARNDDASTAFSSNGNAAVQLATPAMAAAAAKPQPVISPAVKDALLLVFSRQGSYVQELLVEEAVAAVDALARSSAGTLLLGLTGAQAASNTAANIFLPPSSSSAQAIPGLPSGSLFPGLLPFPQAPFPLLPQAAVERLQPFVELSEDDEEALKVVRGISTLLTRAAAAAAAAQRPAVATAGGPNSPANAARAQAAASEVSSLARELAPGIALTIQRFNQALVTRARQRLSEGVTRSRSRSRSVSPMPGGGSSNSNSSGTMAVRSPSPVSSSSNARSRSGTPSVTPGPSSGTAMRPAGRGSSKVSPSPSPYTKPSQEASGAFSADQLLGSGGRIRATAASPKI